MKQVIVEEEYQNGYSYTLVENQGSNFDPIFKPQLTPKQMLELGVFGGAYFKECPKEFPKSWFKNAKLSSDGYYDVSLNLFEVKASQPLSEWQKKGWIYFEDPLGWFLWYCRYYMGRRIPGEDNRQIKRWVNMKRHVSQITNNCEKSNLSCRTRQRQALLHWAYDSRNM